MSERIKAAIVGPGNIGIDLMMKIIKKSSYLSLEYMAGIVKESVGLKMADDRGITTSYTGISELLEDDGIKIVFDATSAKAHLTNAPFYAAKGKKVIDLTPAAVGKYIIPAINIDDCIKEQNVNMVTCGGQATVPIVYAVSTVQEVEYAEIVSTISSKSAGPGTRLNIDEFTETTAHALEKVGNAKKGKAIIILNPAEPPILMRNTIYVKVDNPDMSVIIKAVENIVSAIQEYVPGYRMIMPPTYDNQKITIMIQVEGAGDYLPVYAGNLDIITSAAIRVGDEFAKQMIAGRK